MWTSPKKERTELKESRCRIICFDCCGADVSITSAYKYIVQTFGSSNRLI